ncbi:hypothetical protein PLESTM_001389200 [Pleodorina starrii]|nr:hypothetical protein PLESTM_001389200 [Pleodorina starrii]
MCCPQELVLNSAFTAHLRQLRLPCLQLFQPWVNVNCMMLRGAAQNLAFSDSAQASTPSSGPPTHIRVLKKEKRLELTYGGGQKLSLPAELLRVCSPSADTRRWVPHSGRERVVSGRRHVGIMSVEPVGNYAIRIHFDDLHSSGIFTWDYMAHLGGPGRWPAMRDYLARLRRAGLSRDPPKGPAPKPTPKETEAPTSARAARPLPPQAAAAAAAATVPELEAAAGQQRAAATATAGGRSTGDPAMPQQHHRSAGGQQTSPGCGSTGRCSGGGGGSSNGGGDGSGSDGG